MIHVRISDEALEDFSKTFPWAVFYTQSQQGLTVVAVIDCRRDPKWIRKHLER